MKNIIFATISIILLLGCAKDDGKYVKDKDVILSLSKNEIHFIGTGASEIVEIKCNTSWKVTGINNDVSVNYEEYEFDQQLYITVEPNNTTSTRNFELIVTAQNKSVKIKLTQDPQGVAVIENPTTEELTRILGEGYSDLREITVKGDIENIDLSILGTLPNLRYMDLSQAVFTTVHTNDFLHGDNSNIEEIKLPDCVTTIEEAAFSECFKLKKINIPKGVKDINKLTFAGCSNLEKIEIPEGIKTIKNGAFLDCHLLAKADIPSTVTTIGEEAFSSCKKLQTINIPNNVTSIGANVFYECESATSINIGTGITSIPDFAFSDCYKITSLTLHNGITEIGEYSFTECKELISINFSNNLEIINKGAFMRCDKLNLITLPSSLKVMNGYVFAFCNSIEDIIIPEGVTTIGRSNFSDMNSLRSVTIPSSVTNIGDYTFYLSPNLSLINCYITTPLSLEPYTLYGISPNCKLKVPSASIDLYNNAREWRRLDVIAL